MGVKLTTESFIKKAREIHGLKYDYSKVEYILSTKKIKIICKKHGQFLQEANAHLCGNGCKICYFENVGNLKRKNIDKFITESKKKFGDKYDYSKVVYINNKTKVEIICPIHGSFFIRPNDHLSQNQGCNECGGTKKLTLEKFIEKANIKHKNKYDYSLIEEYKNNLQLVPIICPLHGLFHQNTKAHYSGGNGCPSCKTSKLEDEVFDELENYNIKIIRNKIHPILKETRQHFDIFLPEYNIAIECNGRQHYTPVDIFGGLKAFEKRKELDGNKLKKCKENNIYLLIYPYFLTKEEKKEFFEKIKFLIYEKN